MLIRGGWGGRVTGTQRSRLSPLQQFPRIIQCRLGGLLAAEHLGEGLHAFFGKQGPDVRSDDLGRVVLAHEQVDVGLAGDLWEVGDGDDLAFAGHLCHEHTDAVRHLAAHTGVDLVGVEPSMTLAYRAEYPKALGAAAVPRVALPQEWLARRLDELPPPPTTGMRHWKLLPHCTERTNAPAATSEWVLVARRLGLPPGASAGGLLALRGSQAGRTRTTRSALVFT